MTRTHKGKVKEETRRRSVAGAGALPISLVLTSRKGCVLPTPALCLRVFSWPWKHSWHQLRASRKCWRVNVPASSLQPVTKRELEDEYAGFLAW